MNWTSFWYDCLYSCDSCGFSLIIVHIPRSAGPYLAFSESSSHVSEPSCSGRMSLLIGICWFGFGAPCGAFALMVRIDYGRKLTVNGMSVIRSRGVVSEVFKGVHGSSCAHWLRVYLVMKTSNHKADDEVVGIASATSAELFRLGVTKPWDIRLRHQQLYF